MQGVLLGRRESFFFFFAHFLEMAHEPQQSISTGDRESQRGAHRCLSPQRCLHVGLHRGPCDITVRCRLAGASAPGHVGKGDSGRFCRAFQEESRGDDHGLQRSRLSCGGGPRTIRCRPTETRRPAWEEEEGNAALGPPGLRLQQQLPRSPAHGPRALTGALS